MSDLYVLKTAGTVPVSLDDMKAYMKVTSSSDDALITSMLAAATTWGENYTGREFRANTWTLLTDEFVDRMCVQRAPVASITSIKHLVADVLDTVATSVYYLKKNLQYAEVLLKEDQSWPTDTDDREQAIEIEFVTETYRDIDAVATAIKNHVAHWYSNRGDCADCASAAKGSGVTLIYDQFRIDRV